MNETFVFLGFIGLGGIETLYVKVINELLERGRTVFVEQIEGPLTHLLDSRARVIGDCEIARTAAAIRQWIASDGGDDADVIIVSMHPWELVRASLLNRELSATNARLRGFHLVTHSRAFFFDSRMPLLRLLLRKTFFRSPRASTYFMNLAARDAHQAYWRSDLSDYPILTLPLAPSDVRWAPSRQDQFRIVSVGRLVPFKGYNRAAASVVATLRAGGADVIWDIYGDGPDRPVIENAIDRAKDGEFVKLRGVVAYEDFNRTVAGYDLFVGMGTALLEAGLIAMPAITAIEGTTDETYGFLYETPLDSVGDKVAGAPTRNLLDAVACAARLSEAEAITVGERCRESAMERSSSIKDVADAIEGSQPWRLDRSDRSWLRRAAVIVGFQKLRRSLRKPG